MAEELLGPRRPSGAASSAWITSRPAVLHGQAGGWIKHHPGEPLTLVDHVGAGGGAGGGEGREQIRRGQAEGDLCISGAGCGGVVNPMST